MIIQVMANKKKIWTSEDDRFLRDNFPFKSSSEIAEQLGCPVYSVNNRAYKLGVKKDPEYLRTLNKRLGESLHESGRVYQYSKGHVPFNRGKKMPAHVYEKAKATMFSKGHTPKNHKPVGYERVNVDGYVEIKIEEHQKFVLKHRLVWEQSNGLIPEGYNVQFRDGNRQNCSLENLYLISRSEQLKNENSMYARYPKEVQLAIQAKGALQRQINKINRNE